VVLDEDVRLFGSVERPSATFCADGTIFNETTADILEASADVTGFHDWLRGKWRHVVGVRFIPLGSSERLLQYLGPHAALRSLPDGRGLELKFSASVPWQNWTDSDQIPSDCRIYRAQGRALALVLSAEYAEWSLRRMVSGFIS
jgi:hypothetical protein